MAEDAKVPKFVKAIKSAKPPAAPVAPEEPGTAEEGPVEVKSPVEEPIEAEVTSEPVESVFPEPGVDAPSRGTQVREVLAEFCKETFDELGLVLTDEDDRRYWIHNGNRVDPRSRVASISNGYFATWYSEKTREFAYNAFPALKELLIDLDAV